MSEPVNLNRVRKQKARAERKAQADRHAVKFGRSGTEKARDLARADKARRDLDGHERET